MPLYKRFIDYYVSVLTMLTTHLTPMNLPYAPCFNKGIVVELVFKLIEVAIVEINWALVELHSTDHKVSK